MSKIFGTNWNIPTVSSLLIAFGVGAVFTLLLRSSPAMESSPRTNFKGNAFYLGVSITFPTTEDKELFKKIFQPLADYVQKYELGTLSYELLDSDKDDKRIQILERYQNKDYYLNIHKTSAAFLKFKEAFQAFVSRGAVLDGHSYLETGIGFI
jgi:quinol monooxygenase YgiN